MNTVRFLGIIASFILLALGSQAQTQSLDEELKWFRYVAEFSEMPASQVQEYLNPYKGPTQFRLNKKKAPWAGNYFPMDKGGIAAQWQTDTYPEKVLTPQQLQKFSREKLRLLSPVEKFDILMGYYDFRTTAFELKNRGPLRTEPPENWEGFCNGIRCAGIMMKEPKYPVVMKNPDGVEVVFEPADMKALAGASYFYVEKYGQIGGPSQSRADAQPNPAVFDLVLRFYLSHHKKAFVIDTHLGSEIWNESVVGFKRKLSPPLSLSADEARRHPRAQRKIEVGLTLDTLGEVDIHRSNKTTRKAVAGGDLLTTLESSYTLFVDDQNRALGGEWKNPSESTRGVDFAWFVGGKGADADHAHLGGNPFLRFEKIQELFNGASHPSCQHVF